jgi:tetratricopeptide (TPR) repeat protein
MPANVKHRLHVCIIGVAAFFFVISPCLAQNAQQYYQQGIEAYGAGDFDLAIKHWKSTAALDPKSAKIHKALGLAYHWKGSGDQDKQKKQENCQMALKEFQTAVFLDPQYAKAYDDMALAYECLNDNGKAIQSYEMAISLNPKLKNSYYSLALLYKQRNEIAKAKQLVKQGDVLSEEPLEDTDEGWYIKFMTYLAWKSLGPTLDELRQ